MNVIPLREERLERALVLARNGRAAEKRRDLSGALGRYEAARALLEGLAPTPLQANLLRWSGSVLRDLGEIDAADLLYVDSFSVAEGLGEIAAKASALNCRAVIAQRRGRVEAAARLYVRAKSMAAEAGDIRLYGMIEQNLGVLANICGELEGALRNYVAALDAFEEVRDEEAAAWVLNNVGMLQTDLGRLAEAEGSFQRGLDIALARGDQPLEGILRTNYGETLIAEAREDWTRAKEGFEALGARRDADRVATLIGELPNVAGSGREPTK